MHNSISSPIILTQIQKLSLILTLALILTFAWTTLAHAGGPGDLDPTFGGTGVVTTSIGTYASGRSIAIQPDGKIALTGYSESGLPLVRYNEDGSLDTTFNGTGVLTTDIDSDDEISDSIIIQANGKIIAAGCKGSDFLSEHNAFLIRYTSNGTIDATLNSTGVVTNTFCGWEADVALAQQSDGKSVMVTTEFRGNPFDPETAIAIARYTITGTLDTTFNSTGIVTTRIKNQNSRGEYAVLQPDNKIIVAGSSSNSVALLRYTITGTLDTTFNATGIVTSAIPSISSTIDGGSLGLQRDGKIIVGHTFNSDGNDYLMLTRYLGNGTLDLDFGQGTGVITTPLGYSGSSNALAVQPNGKIIVSGYSSSNISDNDKITVIRYNSDGSLDTTFNNTGIITTTIASEASYSYALALQSDGKIVVGGRANDGHFAVIRYLGDPILNLTKSVDDSTPASGQAISYTLTLSYNDNTTATNLILTDALDANTTFASASDSGLHQSGVVSWSISSLAPDQTITRTVTVTVGAVASGTLLANTAWLTSAQALTATAGVTAVVIGSGDQTIVGLTAGNDSPTPFPQTTHLTAAVTAGSNVTYTWAFGDGTTGSGSIVSHAYPAVGVYTAVVTAGNATNVVTTSTVVTITAVVTPGTGITLSFASGVTITVPAGVFTDTVTLIHTPHSITNTGVLSHVGLFYTISAMYQAHSLPAQPQAGKRYTITVTYQQADVPPGLDESILALYVWNGSQWFKEPSSMVDTEANTITATPHHFSLWAALGAGVSEEHVLLPIILKQ